MLCWYSALASFYNTSHHLPDIHLSDVGFKESNMVSPEANGKMSWFRAEDVLSQQRSSDFQAPKHTFSQIRRSKLCRTKKKCVFYLFHIFYSKVHYKTSRENQDYIDGWRNIVNYMISKFSILIRIVHFAYEINLVNCKACLNAYMIINCIKICIDALLYEINTGSYWHEMKKKTLSVEN